VTGAETEADSVLFVCVRNGGKSQMAAGPMRRVAPSVAVHSAGTDPGPTLNALSVEVLDEIDIDIDITGEKPQAIDPELPRSVDLVVTLGREARVEVPAPGLRLFRVCPGGGVGAARIAVRSSAARR
jgi:arsenate-mycothiol transferase